MELTLKIFSELSTTELFAIYKLRAQVFVVEQNCPYLDVDDKDLQAFHLCRFENKILVAYCRLLPPGVASKYAAIGRVVVSKNERARGFGKLIMQEAIKQCAVMFDSERISISAQTYLMKFYEELGFVTTGKEYLEDDIPHMKMEYFFVKN